MELRPPQFGNRGAIQAVGQMDEGKLEHKQGRQPLFPGSPMPPLLILEGGLLGARGGVVRGEGGHSQDRGGEGIGAARLRRAAAAPEVVGGGTAGGGQGKTFRGISSPHTVCPPLRTPAWRSTSAGRCPGEGNKVVSGPGGPSPPPHRLMPFPWATPSPRRRQTQVYAISRLDPLWTAATPPLLLPLPRFPPCPLPPPPRLTREAKMEPPIHGLNRRSMVLLLAMSFSRMLCGEGGKRVTGDGGSGATVVLLARPDSPRQRDSPPPRFN